MACRTSPGPGWTFDRPVGRAVVLFQQRLRNGGWLESFLRMRRLSAQSYVDRCASSGGLKPSAHHATSLTNSRLFSLTVGVVSLDPPIHVFQGSHGSCTQAVNREHFARRGHFARPHIHITPHMFATVWTSRVGQPVCHAACCRTVRRCRQPTTVGDRQPATLGCFNRPRLVVVYRPRSAVLAAPRRAAPPLPHRALSHMASCFSWSWQQGEMRRCCIESSNSFMIMGGFAALLVQEMLLWRSAGTSSDSELVVYSLPCDGGARPPEPPSVRAPVQL